MKRGEESEQYQKIDWSEMAGEARVLSLKLNQELEDPNSVVSRAMDFARTVRLDPIWQGAKKIRRATDGSEGLAGISEHELSQFFDQA